MRRVIASNAAVFIAIAQRDATARPPAHVSATDAHFEQVGAVEGACDRLVLYRGSLLHSGIVPPGMARSPDPRIGCLTANPIVTRGRN